MRSRMLSGSLLCLASLVMVLCGCDTTSKQRRTQLESVAKDWSMTIRASQVIPVYPMAEDLVPGDVFLVQRTVDTQHLAYEAKGFLAFENHLERLDPSGFDAFYAKSFYKATEPSLTMPQAWLLPGEKVSFGRAPGAAFPAYTFSVSKGSGFTAALPIQGVPVGLSMLNSASANGSVTIKDAHTYGVDIMSLLPDVQVWERENRDFLKMYEPREGANGEIEYNYVRVVNRVYLTGKLNVTLNATGSFSGGGSVGVPKPVELPLLSPPGSNTATAVNTANADSYKKGLDALNKALEGSAAKDAAGNILPGATLKVVSSSARSVSIDETFKRPVVIGYLGFDMAILPGGELGAPMPTYAVLERGAEPSLRNDVPGYVAAVTALDVASYRAIRAIAGVQGDPEQAAAAALQLEIDRLAQSILPVNYSTGIWSPALNNAAPILQIAAGTAIPAATGPYRALVTYIAQLNSSKLALLDASTRGQLTPQMSQDLAATIAELDRAQSESKKMEPALDRARRLIAP